MQQRKELGFWMCTALVVGNTIGIGIFVLPASLAPYGFNAMIGWGITVLGMTVLARVFARLAREFPAADGPHTYIESHQRAAWPRSSRSGATGSPAGSPTPRIAIGLVGYISKVVPGLDAVSPAGAGARHCSGCSWQ